MNDVKEKSPILVEDEASPKKRKPRCTVDLPNRLEEKLEKIADEYGETKSEVVRRALEHFLKCREYKNKGYETGAFRELENGGVRLVSLDFSVD